MPMYIVSSSVSSIHHVFPHRYRYVGIDCYSWIFNTSSWGCIHWLLSCRTQDTGHGDIGWALLLWNAEVSQWQMNLNSMIFWVHMFNVQMNQSDFWCSTFERIWIGFHSFFFSAFFFWIFIRSSDVLSSYPQDSCILQLWYAKRWTWTEMFRSSHFRIQLPIESCHVKYE